MNKSALVFLIFCFAPFFGVAQSETAPLEKSKAKRPVVLASVEVFKTIMRSVVVGQEVSSRLGVFALPRHMLFAEVGFGGSSYQTAENPNRITKARSEGPFFGVGYKPLIEMYSDDNTTLYVTFGLSYRLLKHRYKYSTTYTSQLFNEQLTTGTDGFVRNDLHILVFESSILLSNSKGFNVEVGAHYKFTGSERHNNLFNDENNPTPMYLPGYGNNQRPGPILGLFVHVGINDGLFRTLSNSD